MLKTLLVIAPIVLSIGCASIKTTFLQRFEDDTLCKEEDHPINGVPVMVKVPSHVEVQILERVHFIQDSDTSNVKPLATPGRPIRVAKASLRMTEKMFVVDPKRPFSGSLAYGIGFKSGITIPEVDKAGKAQAKVLDTQGHGYLDSLTYQVEDKTLEESIKLLANVVPLLATAAANGEPEEGGAGIEGVHTTTRTIAFGLFDLNAPDFEARLTAFLELHLNQCTPCAPGTQHIKSAVLPRGGG